jgi:hypothetical protein
MDENLSTAPDDFKLYSIGLIAFGTIIGGPLIGGYLIAENFKHLKQKRRCRITWIISLIATFILSNGFYFVENFIPFPPYALSVIYTLIGFFIVNKYQDKAINAHIQNGRQLYSIKRVVLVALVGLAITIGMYLIIFLLPH